MILDRGIAHFARAPDVSGTGDMPPERETVGSAVVQTCRPPARRRSAKRGIWVDFPEPSMPSTTIKRPRCVGVG